MAAKRSAKKSSARRRQQSQAQASARRATPPAKPDPEAEAEQVKADDLALKVLVPQKEVKLLCGDRITISPWPFSQTQILLPRLGAIYDAFLESQSTDAGSLANDMLITAFTETKELVRESMSPRWSDEEMDRMTMEDGLTLATTMVEVCLLRPDGGGVLPKVAKLIGAMNSLMGTTKTTTAPTAKRSPAG